VAGDIFIDVMAKIQDLPKWDADTEAKVIQVLPGGSALNQARNLHGLGVDVRFLGSLGNDDFGKMLKQHCSSQGFPMDWVKTFDKPSSVCMVLSGPADRAFVSCYSTTEAYTSKDMEESAAEATDGCSHFHLGGYFNMGGLQDARCTALMQTLKGRGLTTSMNLQYDASGAWSGKDGHLREALRFTDFLFVNEVEAEEVAKALLPAAADGSKSVPQALCDAYPDLAVVMTKGKDGAYLLRKGQPQLHVPTAPLDTVVDATGAGDAFVGGFLSVWVDEAGRVLDAAAREELLRKAMRTGHAAAGVCVQRDGACVVPVRPSDLPRE